jgi:hypothetical protein
VGTSVQNFFTSRDNNVDPATYVGQLDRLWYNPDTNQLFISDGVTPGGRPVDLGANANALINTLTVSNITGPAGTVALIGNINISQLLQAASGNITGNLVVGGNISPATDVKIGGVRAGPGANISNTGLLTIDSANVPFSFGNFTAANNLLTIVNSDEDMILATQGSAEIQLVGNIGFYKSNGFPPDPNNQFFFARDDGQLRILVPAEDPLEGGVEIIGSATGNYVTPGTPGTMLQLTGNPDLPCRLYHDSLRNYSSYVARRYNGTTASPGQVLAGEDVFRINTTAATDAGMGNVAMCQVSFTALEDQTTTAQGSSITFTVTPIGSPAASRVDVATITVADGVTATKFTTAGTVTATGNITGGNVAGTTFTGNVVGNVTGTATTATNLAGVTSILASTITVNPAEVAGTTSSTQTFTLTGLTTNHKIIITSGTAINSGLVITAAWASALNTVSIEFRNTTNQAIDAGNLTIQYFAWV